MRTELDERSVAELRRVLARMESSAPLAPDLETVAAPVVAPERRRLNGIVIAGMTALAIFAVVIPTLLFSGRQPEQAPIASPPSTDAPTTPPTTVRLALNTEWTAFVVDKPVDAMTVHQSRIFAVALGAVLTSADGIDWEEVGELPTHGWASARRLVSHGDYLVAAGDEILPEADGGRAAHSAVWASSDLGATWTKTLLDGFHVDLASTPEGLVIAGFVVLGQEGDHVLRQAIAWTSDDGGDWTVAWNSDDPGGTSSRADAVAWDGEGLTILGWSGPHDYHEGAGKPSGPIWDRVAWTGPRTADLTSPIAIDLRGFTQALEPPIALTFGLDQSVKDSSAVWGSADGVAWTPIEVDPGPWSYQGVAVGGNTIVVTAYALGDRGSSTGVWVSTDLNNWEALDVSSLPDGVGLGPVVLHNDVLVAAGHPDAGPYGLFTTRLVR